MATFWKKSCSLGHMFSLNFDYLLFPLFPVRDVGSDFGVSCLCNFVSGLIYHKKYYICFMFLYFSPAVSSIQIIPNLDPIILGSSSKPILPHIFTFDNYLFKRCFLFIFKPFHSLKTHFGSTVISPMVVNWLVP